MTPYFYVGGTKLSILNFEENQNNEIFCHISNE